LLCCNCVENSNNIHNKDWWIENIPHQTENVEKAENFEEFVNDRENSIFNHIKDNYILNVYFEFEIKIRNIVRQLGDVPNLNKKNIKNQPYLIGNEPWFYIYKGLFYTYLSLRKENIEVIELYTAVRNLVHNGGFYYHTRIPKLQLDFMNQTYTFENSKPINFLALSQIQNIYNMLLELIDLVYSNPKINSVNLIKDPIADVKFQ